MNKINGMQKIKTLPYNTVNQLDAIEKRFCVKFEKLEQKKMDGEISDILISLVLMKQKSIFQDIPSNEVPHLCLIINKKISSQFSYTVSDDRVVLFIALLTENPGLAIMYLWYLQYYCKKKNIQDVDLTIFARDIFPRGFPSKKDLEKLWDKQKIDNANEGFSDNLLDYRSAGQSIQIKINNNNNNN
jgi:hypothetical protein